MIPKVIHYCWFDKNKKSPIVKRSIESWHKYASDWEVRYWDESTFDVEMIPYTKEVHEKKKYAFGNSL